MKEIIFYTSKHKKSDGTDYSTIVDDDIYKFNTLIRHKLRDF